MKYFMILYLTIITLGCSENPVTPDELPIRFSVIGDRTGSHEPGDTGK